MTFSSSRVTCNHPQAPGGLGQRRFALALMGRRRDALWRPHAGLKALRFGPPRIA